MLKNNKSFNHTKGKKHGQCHVCSNTDFNNHNTARDETLSLKLKAPTFKNWCKLILQWIRVSTKEYISFPFLQTLYAVFMILSSLFR